MAAITHDVSAEQTTTTQAFSVASNSNRLLIVNAVGALNSDSITGVTYNGVAMTLVQKLNVNSDRYTYMFYLLAPATGSNNVVIQGTGWVAGSIHSYYNVKQSAQPDASGTNSNIGQTSISKAITTITDKCWLVGYMFDAGGTPTIAAQAGTTIRVQTAENAAGIDSNGAKTPAGSYGLGIDFGSAPDDAVIIVASFAPVDDPSASLSISSSVSPSSSISPSPSLSISPSPSVSVSSSISLSPSVSVSLSPSITGSSSHSLSSSSSISPSSSVSISVSGSKSPSFSYSRSNSPSHSPSISRSLSVSRTPSVSVSRSNSPSPSVSDSPSPSAPLSDYTREAVNGLPSNKSDLSTTYTTSEEQDVDHKDGRRVPLIGIGGYHLIHQFKKLNTNRKDRVKIHIVLQSTLSCEDSPVYLQIWNGLTNAWETLDTDSTTAVGSDVDLRGEVSDTAYYDFNNEIACRVFQLAT